MRTPRSMTPLARGPEVRPLGAEPSRCRIVVVLLPAHMAADAALVPLLDDLPVVLVRPDDLDVVEPFAALHVPAWRQHHHPPFVERREVVLNASAAERVLDAVLLGFTGELRLGDEVLPVLDAKPVAPALQRRAAAREVAFDRGGRRRLDHLAVPPGRPCVVHLAMTGRARRRTHVPVNRSLIALSARGCRCRLDLRRCGAKPKQRQPRKHEDTKKNLPRLVRGFVASWLHFSALLAAFAIFGFAFT